MPLSTKELFAKRASVIETHRELKPNYFDWKKELELEYYSTYIYITPRSIGKTYSAFEIAFELYEATGEYTTWMRTSKEEVKECTDDYMGDRPYEFPDYVVWKGRKLIDERNGHTVIKFVALSTVHNLASITGTNCGLIVYDEFLPRTNRRLPRAFHKLTDFIKTVERNFLMTVLLQANATTLNSDILMQWDLWNDVDEKDDREKRMKYRYIREWANPPSVGKISTASRWASNSEDLEEFMTSAKFLDGDGGLVLPESRLGDLRHLTSYRIDDITFTLSITNDDQFVCVLGDRVDSGVIYALTMKSALEKGRYVRPVDIPLEFSKIAYALENDNLTFTSYHLKDTVINYCERVYGKIQKHNT